VGVFVVLLTLLLGCTRRPPAPRANDVRPIELTDDVGQSLHLAGPARRIISLIPSATETVMGLGATDRLLARTRYDREDGLAHLPMVGGGLDPSAEAIVQLRPDPVLLWSSDKRSDLRRQLEGAGIATGALSLEDTSDAYRAIAWLGRALDLPRTADSVLRSLRASLDSTAAMARRRPRRRVFYVVYNDPPMTAGPRTFIGQILNLAGGDNIFADVSTNWPTVSLEDVVRRQPDVVVLPVGEMPARTIERLRTESGWRELQAVQRGCVGQVEADAVNRPGPNLARAARRLFEVIHLETCPRP